MKNGISKDSKIHDTEVFPLYSTVISIDIPIDDLNPLYINHITIKGQSPCPKELP